MFYPSVSLLQQYFNKCIGVIIIDFVAVEEKLNLSLEKRRGKFELKRKKILRT
mgnify:CR=1 FL=1